MFEDIWQGALSIAGGIALTIAVLVTWAAPTTAPTTTAPPTLPAVSPVALPDECPSRKAVLNGESTRLLAELEAVDLQLRIAEQRRLRREGVEQPWPDDPDPPEKVDATRTVFRGERYAEEIWSQLAEGSWGPNKIKLGSVDLLGRTLPNQPLPILPFHRRV